MHAAAMQIELYLRECRSLKSKRSVIKPIIEGLNRRHRVSVSEVDHQDTWRRAALGVAAVASSHTHLVEILDEAERFVWSFPDVEVLQVQRHWMEES